ncbi:MAG: hypothetical protein JXR77_12275, partial [Lentisphaeria bacterium]|nr:hypothetical protein [Lentisphaeria bacterium]
MMRVMGLVAMGLGMVLPAQEYGCGFVGLPERVVSAAVLPLQVRYALPEGAPPARLHVEVKGSGGYHAIETRMVDRTGTAAVPLRLPSRAVSREVHFVVWLGEHWENPLGKLVRSPMIEVISEFRAARLERQRLEADSLRREWLAGEGDKPLVGIHAGAGTAWAQSLRGALAAALPECRVAALDHRVLDNPHLMRPDAVPLLVLCDPRSIPSGARDALPGYLARGGKILVLGGDPFRYILWEFEGRWCTSDEYRQAMFGALRSRSLFAFDTDTEGVWQRGSNTPEKEAGVRWEADGADGGCLAVHIADLSGWETFQHAVPPGSIPEDHTWLTLQLQADEQTPQVAVEIRETDGSRWIATVPVGRGWQGVALPPSAFHYWHDSTSEGRGEPGDALVLSRAAAISIGLAHTHTTQVPNGPHRFRVDSIGTSPAPGAEIDLDPLAAASADAPRIETVAPRYKTFPVTNLDHIRANAVQALVPPWSGRDPAAVRAPHARPQGTGIHKSRRWRFVPLLECRDRADRFCGTAAGVLLCGEADGGGLVASVPVLDDAFFADPATQGWIAALASRLVDGLFLYEGGAAHYASFGGEGMAVGARVVARGSGSGVGEVR